MEYKDQIKRPLLVSSDKNIVVKEFKPCQNWDEFQMSVCLEGYVERGGGTLPTAAEVTPCRLILGLVSQTVCKIDEEIPCSYKNFSHSSSRTSA